MDIALRARQILSDEAGEEAERLASAEVYTASVAGALLELSRLRPRVAQAELELEAGPDQPYPPGWDAGISSILSVEFPPGSRRPRMLAASSLLTGPDGWRILDRPYREGDRAVLTFTLPWTQASIPDSLAEAAAHLAASLVAQAVAARFGRSNAPAIPADSVNYREKADVWRELSAHLRRRGLAIAGAGADAQGNAAHSPAARHADWGWPQL